MKKFKLGPLQRKLLHLLDRGPDTTGNLADGIGVNREHVRLALKRLEAQGLVVGWDLLAGLESAGPIQFKCWRIPTAREKSKGRVDLAINTRQAARIYRRILPTLAKIKRWNSILKEDAERSPA